MNMSRWSPTHRFRARSVRIARRDVVQFDPDLRAVKDGETGELPVGTDDHQRAPGKPSQNALVDALPRLAE
jgi:hypothetical protein